MYIYDIYYLSTIFCLLQFNFSDYYNLNIWQKNSQFGIFVNAEWNITMENILVKKRIKVKK